MLETTTPTSTPLTVWAAGVDCCLGRADFWCTAEAAYGGYSSDWRKREAWALTNSTKTALRAVPKTEGDEMG